VQEIKSSSYVRFSSQKVYLKSAYLSVVGFSFDDMLVRGVLLPMAAHQ